MKQNFYFHDDVIVLSIRCFDDICVIFKTLFRVHKMFFFYSICLFLFIKMICRFENEILMK